MRPHPLNYLIEPILDQPSLVERPMFGCMGYYLNGKLQIVLASQEQPWHGMLIATDFQHHQSLQLELPQLLPHPVLKKWLYIPEDHESFESYSDKIVQMVLKGDARIGVLPRPKRRRGNNHLG